MRLFFIPLLVIVLFASGWLFREPLAANGGKLFVRIFIGLFAVAGVIAWTLLLLAFMWFASVMAAGGDGSGTGVNTVPPKAILWVSLAWLVPVTAFAFMLLGALNVVRGALRHIGYWYALLFLVIAGSVMMVLFPYQYAAVKWVGLVCLLVSVLWCYGFRMKAPPVPQ